MTMKNFDCNEGVSNNLCFSKEIERTFTFRLNKNSPKISKIIRSSLEYSIFYKNKIDIINSEKKIVRKVILVADSFLTIQYNSDFNKALMYSYCKKLNFCDAISMEKDISFSDFLLINIEELDHYIKVVDNYLYITILLRINIY